MFDYSFHWRSAFKALPDMLAGAWVTLETAALSMLLGTLIALLLTVMRQMPSRRLAKAAVNCSGMCWTMTMPGQSWGMASRNSREGAGNVS